MEKIEECVNQERIISVREAGKEIDKYHAVDDLTKWKLSNPSFFPPPTEKETKFITEIFSIRHFQMLVIRKRSEETIQLQILLLLQRQNFILLRCFLQKKKELL